SGVQPGASVFALTPGTGSALYVGGTFATAGGVTVNKIAQWNGTSWSALGTGLSDGYVTAGAVSGNNFYIGGLFAQAGGVAGPNFGKWVGIAWTTFLGPNGPDYDVAIAPDGD